MFKKNKAPGENQITVEMIVKGGDQLEEELYQIIARVWEEENMSNRWKGAIIYPTHKKKDATNCENSRPMALLDVAYKILATIIKNRLSVITERRLGQYQCGFRKNRSVTDQIFTLKQIMDNSIGQKLPVYMVFIDFKQAYDTAKREKFYETMSGLGIPSKYMKLVKMTLKEMDY